MALAARTSQSQSLAPTTALAFLPEHPTLQQARALSRSLPQAPLFAGSVAPAQAWELFAQQSAVLLDVRTAEERKFVGYVPGSLHLPWLLGTAMQTNPRFVRELESKVPKHAVILMLCRSGARSASAAAAASRAGFQHVFAILEGFEGDLDEQGHRGGCNGWRFHGLPWEQD
jgi:rhodanese-related sulfurtransferase